METYTKKKWPQKKKNLIHEPQIKNLSSELKRKLKEILAFFFGGGGHHVLLEGNRHQKSGEKF